MTALLGATPRLSSCFRRFLVSNKALFASSPTTLRCTTTASSKPPLVLVSHDDAHHIATLTLNNPKKANVLSSDMLDQLQDALAEIRDDDTVRVVILKSSSDAVFSAGHDLQELLDMSETELHDLMKKCSRTMSMLSKTQPTIAQVNGIATAAGCQLVASCDLAVCGVKSKFAVSGIHVGLFCATPAVALSRCIPTQKHALHMLLTGEMVDAYAAQHYGLVNGVVEEDQLEQATNELARKISQKSPESIQLGKRLYYKQLTLPLEQAYELASNEMVRNLQFPDTRREIRAFLERKNSTKPKDDDDDDDGGDDDDDDDE